MCAGGGEVLRDVVTRRAGAEHKRSLARPVETAAIVAGVAHDAFEVVQARQFWPFRDGADAVAEHDVPWAHHARAAVASPERRRPMLLCVVIVGAHELG